MSVEIRVRNESSRKRLYRRDVLSRLAEHICQGEKVSGEVEVSVLFCDDPFMQQLNREYRGKNVPTDVLSFEQEDMPLEGVRALGDIVISLETVERNCSSNSKQMRDEVRMLVCHGLLHLLGYDHGTLAEKEGMVAKQAQYLGISEQDAWSFGPKKKKAMSLQNGGA